MTLDHRRWSTYRDRLDHVRIKSSLHEVSDVTQAPRFCFKDIDKNFADLFSLLLGIGDATQCVEELTARTNTRDVQLHALLQQRQRRFKLTFAQQSVIDKNTRLPIANRAMDQ